jgi:hypothetical protein
MILLGQKANILEESEECGPNITSIGRVEPRPEDGVKCQRINDLSWPLAENDPNPS